MKKKNLYLFAALSIALCAASCQKENELTPSVKNEKVSVIVSLGEQTKGFSDTEGITWEVGDQIKYAGGVELTSDPLTAEQISDNGHTAAFQFAASLIQADRKGWFVSTKCHPSNYTEVEYTLGVDNGNVFTQDVAGEMNNRYLFLHSGTGLVSIQKDVTPTIKMDVAGTILRVLPYTTTFNDETVLSVKFESNDNVVGTVSYDRGGGSYRSVDDISWKVYTFVKANLGTAFSLSGVTSAETSKGIYLPVAATKADDPLNGYKYTVETDKATYTFDAMDMTMAVANNVVKNVYLNLDMGVRETESGYLKYTGALTEIKIPSTGCTDQDAGYWKALVSTDGSSWADKLYSENAVFYSDVVFSYTDATTDVPVDWISVKYGGSDLCHWLVTAQENTGEERKVKITATYSNVKGYVIQEESKTKVLTLTQSGSGSNKILTFFGGIGDATIDATGVTNKSLGYCVIDVDGVHAEDWSGDSHNEDLLYGSVTITPYVFGTGVGAGATVADWLTVGYGKDSEGNFNSTHILVNAEDNTGSERKALVYCEYIAPDGYEFEGGAKSVYKQFIITQKEGLSVEASLSNVYAETVPAAGATITAATLALTVNGAAQADVAAALTTYGFSVTADKGATASVAADGTVTLTVPENKYKNGGVTYTLSVKRTDGTVLASASINQAEGTEEPIGNKYEYTIVKNNGNASGSAWGMPNTQKNGADFTIKDIKLNGEAVTLDAAMAEEVLNQAFEVKAEKRETDTTHEAMTANQFYMFVLNYNGNTLNAGLATQDAANYACKVVWYNSDGTEAGYWFIFAP